MEFFKNKFVLPLILVGLLSGYYVAEWFVPKYFHPTQDTKIKTVDILQAIGAQPNYYRQTASGNYLAGQFAQNRKDWGKANDYMDRVLRKENDNSELKKHNMVLSMASGRTHQSVKIAQEIIKDEPDNILAVLFLTMDAFDNQDYAKVKELLNNAPQDSAAAFLVPVLKLWADTADKKLDTQYTPPSSFYAYHVMLIGEYLGKQKKALNYATRAFSTQDSDIRDVEKIADLFYKLDNKETAKKLYEAILEKDFGSENLPQKIANLSNDQPIKDLLEIKDIKSPKEGAALVFYDMASILVREQSDDSATIFAKMSLKLDPSLEENHMVIGSILARYEQYEQAISSLKKIKFTHDLYNNAQRQIAELYAADEQNEEARNVLIRLYDKTGDIDALIQVGDIYRYEEDYENAVKVYNNIIDDWEETPEKYWHVLYARGMAYERLGEFKKSETDLIQALEFRPDHPYVLNYLGYSWADQGINLEKSLDMLSRALQAKPNDGYIADSLGWVHYKMGQYEEAIPFLERALELMPYDATLNDHLGDAYWRVDRKLEAKFQWERARNYSEDDEIEVKESVTEKLISGLPEDEEKKNEEEKNILTDFFQKDNDV